MCWTGERRSLKRVHAELVSVCTQPQQAPRACGLLSLSPSCVQSGSHRLRQTQNMRLAALLETKVVVSGATFAFLCMRRDVATAVFIYGAICNALLSKLLKRMINAARPAGAQLSDPGMPSSHAMSLFFFAAFLSSGLLEWDVWPRGALLSTQHLELLRPAAACCVVVLAAVLALLRVRAGLHTIAQVSVGSAIGACNGALWYRYGAGPLEQYLEVRIDGLSGASTKGIAGALVLVGALTVLSVERTMGEQLKRRGAGNKES